MASSLKVDTSNFSRAIRDLSQRNDRSQTENIYRYAKTILTNRQGTGIVDLTPPGGNSARGTDARRHGESAIQSDLTAVFVPVTLKHKRPERWPDVEGIHRARWQSDSRFNNRLTRGQRQPFYVDARKLAHLRRLLFARVGRMASGWAAAAHELAVRIPSWIARHGTDTGDVTLQTNGPRKAIEFGNTVPTRAPVAETERRLQAAVDYATARIDRDFADGVRRAASAAGFRVL